MAVGDRLTGVSIIGSEFHGTILGETTVGDLPAIRPQISGRAWVTGTHQHMLDPSDPRPALPHCRHLADEAARRRLDRISAQ